jgi:Niemann-Pick C1 protein
MILQRKRLVTLATLACALLSSATALSKDAMKHEKGRCAMRGHCGKESFFGGELPCPDNGPAETPEKEMRKSLVDVCGDKWNEGDVCCSSDQVDALKTNLKRADTFIASCPACKENFYNLFCTFTCSPDQSTFINITDTAESNTGETIVTELDNLWSDRYGNGFYDSCKEVKFGATGSKAMSLIGGGAKNYTEFLAFLGKKSPLLGSPFQINFPRPAGRENDGMKAADPDTKACNDKDEKYRCACVDCPASCAKLAELSPQKYCHVGRLPCLSFASVLIYSVLILLVLGAILGHVIYRKHARRRDERLRLLQDTSVSDDEDEDDLVHNTGLMDRPRRHYKLNSICDSAFTKLGGMCARYPMITIGLSFLAILILSLGWINFEVERDPVRLWVSPTSAAAMEKEFFDANFGPFYRTEQVFLVNDTNPGGLSPVLSYDTLEWWFDVEHKIKTMDVDGITLSDVCFNPTGDACVVQSLTGYWQGQFSSERDNWQKKLQGCIDTPVECLPEFQQPLNKDLLLGGYEGDNALNASAMIVTWVVQSHQQGSDEEARAMSWERGLKNTLMTTQQEARSRGLRLSFNTEISLEEELNQATNTDANIVVISYIIMFIYASIALGSSSLSSRAILNNLSSAFVQSKFTLGISGIIIVLMSVSASVGFFSAIGVKVTLIIAEVIPFLVLAVGVDNIFLLVHEFERVNQNYPDEEIDSRIAKALGRMGPSILLSGLTETVTFVLGVFVGMPAVKNFAAYAAGAIFINAILQVTMFVSVLALNQRRVESNRVDCFPFIKIKQYGRSRNNSYNTEESEGMLQKFIRKHYAPALLKRQVKVLVCVVFAGFFAAGIALIPEMPLGLDQRIAIPTGSYLIPYFNDLYEYFNSGPPVYFVTKGVNATSRAEQRGLCGRFTTCDQYSLANVLELESQRSDVSYITGATANWLDDFLFWLNPLFEDCCKEHGDTCFAKRDPNWNITLSGMPEGEEFIHYVDMWLKAPTDANCPLGGKAGYSSAVVVDKKQASIPASNFRTSHTPLRSQEDFISAYASARRIAEGISKEQGIEVFPYSLFYIFFDQYASIVDLTGALLGAALGLILVITSILLGSVVTGAVVTFTVIMIVVDILGTMVLAGVSLNAVSLVNLIICVGIGVEFCAHIARAFMFPSRAVMDRARGKFKGRDARAWTALVNVGGSVFTGITVTKLLGVCVLAFTRSKIFEVYYFRVWLALVIWAALHALVFLPVALSLVGGEGKLKTIQYSVDSTNYL